MSKLFLLLFLALCLVTFVYAEETRNIEYAINITYLPYCPEIQCNTVNITYNVTTFNNETNQTNITSVVNGTNTTCSATCYGRLKLEGINDNNIFVEIDAGSDEWKNGKSDLRYGYKTASLGNLSDISGIREELKNLSSGFSSILELNTNLTECAAKKSNLEQQISSSNSQLNLKDSEINDIKNQKYYFGIGGLLLGMLFIWKGLPIIKGTKNPRDPTMQFPSNTGFR